MKLKVNTRHKPAKQSIRYTAGDQCIPVVNGIMNSENAPKETVKSFIDLSRMAKGLIYENQQPSNQQELEKTVPQYKRWREGS